MFMTRLEGEHSMFKVFPDNHATLHVFKNVAKVSDIGAARKARIGGSKSGMSTAQVCYIPYAGLGLFMIMQLLKSYLGLSVLSLGSI